MDRVEKEEFIVASGYNMLSPGFMREKGYTKFFATKKTVDYTFYWIGGINKNSISNVSYVVIDDNMLANSKCLLRLVLFANYVSFIIEWGWWY